MGTYNGAALGHQPDVRQHSRGGSENENRCNAIILKSHEAVVDGVVCFEEDEAPARADDLAHGVLGEEKAQLMPHRRCLGHHGAAWRCCGVEIGELLLQFGPLFIQPVFVFLLVVVAFFRTNPLVLRGIITSRLNHKLLCELVCRWLATFSFLISTHILR
jgi:hypothetical protein